MLLTQKRFFRIVGLVLFERLENLEIRPENILSPNDPDAIDTFVAEIFWIITPSGQILRFGETTPVVLTVKEQ